MKYVVVILFAMTTFGCLKTRSEMKDTETRQAVQQQVVSLQKNTADSSNHFAELEEQMRALNGRTEVLENRLSVKGQETDREKKSLADQNAELYRKVNILQESLGKMEQQISVLATQMTVIEAQNQAQANARGTPAAATSKKNYLETAQDHFAQKEWKKAILNFEKYREDSPKGKQVAEATYKIGVCFQELGLKDEAKTFFEEVIARFPKSEDSKRAKIRLKGLKK